MEGSVGGVRMGVANPVPGKRIVKKVKIRKEIPILAIRLLQFVCSPLLLFIDIFRPRPSKVILQAYLWLMLGIFLLTVTIYFYTEGQQTQLERVLRGYFTYSEAAVPVSTEIQEIIHRHALLVNVSPQLVAAVIQVESGFDPEAYSPKGACGLMQLTPLVWQAYNPNSICNGKHRPGGADHGRDCIFNVEANIGTGVRYLKKLIDYYDGETGRALEAYNAGLTNVDLEEFRPKYQETRNYLARIGKLLTAEDHESFMALYEVNHLCHSLLKGLLLLTMGLWVIFMFWVKKHKA